MYRKRAEAVVSALFVIVEQLKIEFFSITGRWTLINLPVIMRVQYDRLNL